MGWWNQARTLSFPPWHKDTMGVPKLPANFIPLEAARENPQSDSQRKMHTNQ